MKVSLSIPENAKTHRYDIQIGSQLLVNAFDIIQEQFPNGRMAIVTDGNYASHIPPELLEAALDYIFN